MGRKKKTKVFVSYSRHDEALVRPLAGLLGVAAEEAVFLDVEQLRPGDVWEEKLVAAVREASVFVLCWCCESRRSEFVAKEIGLALEDRRKRLVPVLFCGAELPEALRSRQWIDLRGKVVHVCSHGKKAAAAVARERMQTAQRATEQRVQASRRAAWDGANERFLTYLQEDGLADGGGAEDGAGPEGGEVGGVQASGGGAAAIAARARRYFEGLRLG